MDEQQTSHKRIYLLGGSVLLLILLGVAIYFFLSRTGSTPGGTHPALFGTLGGNSDVRPQTETNSSGTSTLLSNSITGDNSGQAPLFRQLSTIPVAGAATVTHNGSTYVRYVARENGHVFEVDPATGASTELTNTTIPRIYEALWGNNGNTVVLRYLSRDAASQQDTIKTYLAYLDLPTQNASSTNTLGTLTGDFLPDNITAASVSPDGKQLFYLLPVASEGVSGTIVNLTTRSAKEVLRSAFSEWLPQLLNDGTVILTTKPSANTPGFSYQYDPTQRTFSRLLREKNGLTTQSNNWGTRVLYAENISGNPSLGEYDKKGFGGDEGVVSNESQIPLQTLPEKCAWTSGQVMVYCGAFASAPRAQLPDAWYQGTLTLSDTFWSVDTDTAEITLLADPQQLIGKNFDVLTLFTDTAGQYLFFVNKTDEYLWSLRPVGQIQETTGTSTPLTPAEMQDAAGSIPATSTYP